MSRWSRVFRVFLVMVFVVTTAFSTGTQLSTAKSSVRLKSDSKKKSKILIAYFGRYGNTNFGKDVDATTSASIVKDGKKKRGTTEMLARLIQKETGEDLFRSVRRGASGFYLFLFPVCICYLSIYQSNG